MAWYRKHYRCDDCGTEWTDEWSCCCNDHCPECDAEIESHTDDDLTIVVEGNAKEGFDVLISAGDAEDGPDYQHVARFGTKPEAEAFAEKLPTIGQDDAAAKEGWGLFDVSGTLQILADGESTEFVRGGYSHDEEAKAFVESRAADGSLYHKAALARVGTLDW